VQPTLTIDFTVRLDHVIPHEEQPVASVVILILLRVCGLETEVNSGCFCSFRDYEPGVIVQDQTQGFKIAVQVQPAAKYSTGSIFGRIV
jgi:hypothetical protein